MLRFWKGRGTKVFLHWSREPPWGTCTFLFAQFKGHRGNDHWQRRQLPPWSIRPGVWLLTPCTRVTRGDWSALTMLVGKLGLRVIMPRRLKRALSLHNAQHRVIYKNVQWNCPPVWRIQDFVDDDVRWNGSIAVVSLNADSHWCQY